MPLQHYKPMSYVHGLDFECTSLLRPQHFSFISRLLFFHTVHAGSPHPPDGEVLDSELCPFRPRQYQYLHQVPFLKSLITIILPIVLIIQVSLYAMIFIFSVNQSVNQHSCIGSYRWFMIGAVFLCVLTRAVLPLIMVWIFSKAVISKLGTQSSFLTSDFLKQISREENEAVLQAVVCTFWDVGLAKKTYHTILKTLTQHLAKELNMMCITSILEAIIITVMLFQVGATRFVLDVYPIGLLSGGVLERLIVSLDVLSYFTIILMTGIIYSFFNHEATVNHLIAGAAAIEDHANSFGVKPSKELIMSAKDAVNNFNNSWSCLNPRGELFLFLSVQVYTLILVLFAVAALPLSCGITAHMHVEQVHWVTFIIVFSFGHFLSTFVRPSAHSAKMFRYSGIGLQALLLLALWIVQPPFLGYFLQILLAIIPAAYLSWYLRMKVHYENSMHSAKPKGWKQQHRSNMAIYICFMVQLVAAIIISIYSEFSILDSNQSV